MRKKRHAPILYYGCVPEPQQHALQLVGHALDNLEYYTNGFMSALKLFDYCVNHTKKQKDKRNRNTYRSWQFIAARDGALAIYHFACALNALSQSLNECKVLGTRMPAGALRHCKKKLNAKFPNLVRMRHAVGHAGEKASTTRQHEQHGFTGTYIRDGLKLKNVHNYVITDHLFRRTYCNTWGGKIESYKLNSNSLTSLIMVRDAVFDAVEAANLRLLEL